MVIALELMLHDWHGFEPLTCVTHMLVHRLRSTRVLSAEAWRTRVDPTLHLVSFSANLITIWKETTH